MESLTLTAQGLFAELSEQALIVAALSKGAAKHAKHAIAVLRDECAVDVDWEGLRSHLA
jgi:hypothetical protein